MARIEEIKKILEEHKKELQAKFKVKTLAIFGSYVRDEQKIGSDIDILVEYTEVPDLIAFIELQNYLSELLQAKVDLVTKSTLKPHIGKRILKEAIYL